MTWIFAVPRSYLPDKDIRMNFFIGHCHHPDFWAIVHRHSGIKIDVFGCPRTLGWVEVAYKGLSLRVQSLASQLAGTILDTRSVLRNRPIDPKQFDDAKLQLSIAGEADREKADEYLKEAGVLLSAEAAFAEAQAKRKESPELVIKNPHPKLGTYVCTGCVEMDGYPLASPDEIRAVLYNP